MSDNQKKILAENLKNKLNSPDYIATSDLIAYRLGRKSKSA